MNSPAPDSPTPHDAGAIPAASGGATNTPKRRRRFWMFAGAAGAMTALAACAQRGPRAEAGPEGGSGYGGWGHHHHRRGPMNPEEMARRVDKGVDRVLSYVGATPEQKQKVSAMIKQALGELAPLRERHRAARKQALDLLSAPAIDRAAIEKLRSDELQLAETASRRIASTLADVAEVLTPEQRAKLREGFERRMGRRWG